MLCRSRQSSSAAEGGEVFDLYNKIGYEFWSLFEFLKNELPKDVIVYIIMHDETDDYGNTKLKMLGRLLEQKVCVEGMVTICLRCVSDEKGHFFITNSVEGMVTICLRCVSDEKGHFFITNSDGSDITKSPEEMFDKLQIENDLKAVDTTIREYYEINY